MPSFGAFFAATAFILFISAIISALIVILLSWLVALLLTGSAMNVLPEQVVLQKGAVNGNKKGGLPNGGSPFESLILFDLTGCFVVLSLANYIIINS